MPNIPATALDLFVAEPSPRSAIELAISDHRGNGSPNGRMVDWEFVQQLRKAARQLELLQNWRDARLLNELHAGDENVSEQQSADYRAREHSALALLLNS